MALFWKVYVFINVLSIGVGLAGAGPGGVVVATGAEFLLNLATGVHACILWLLFRHSERSIRFSRTADAVGMLINMTLGAFLGRYVLAGFSSSQSIVSAEGALMADGFISMMLLAGTAMLVAIRAAVIPSTALRTVAITAMVGLPLILVPMVTVPTIDGALAWRSPYSGTYPWLPMTGVVMWSFVIITCAVLSRVIYGLRAEVREARQLGQYVLERKLGEGGMGEVYQAHHGMMRRPSAVKLLRAEHAGEANLRRFEREVQLTARLTHPNTITIFDYGRTDDDVFYYAMEFLDGATLQRIVEVGGAQPASRVARIMAMACGALAEAHANGLIHRDIKPANIMLCTQGGEFDIVKVLDFGLVKELEVDRKVDVTHPEAVTGTPQYMAPESILKPESVDARTDIYALGAVAYYLLAGADVFDGKSVVEVCSQHIHEQPQPLSSRGVAVASELEAVVLACLAKDQADRPQSAVELRRMVGACACEPWDASQAQDWWQQHRRELEDDASHDLQSVKTIAVDISRSMASAGQPPGPAPSQALLHADGEESRAG